jgi:hypothetical protein
MESKGRGVLEHSAERSRGGGDLEMMGNDSASSAQSRHWLVLGTSGRVCVIFCSGSSTNSSCRRAERELWNSGCRLVATGGVGSVEQGCSLLRLVVSSVWVQELTWVAGVDDGGVVLLTGDWGVVMGATVERGGALGEMGAG